MRINAIRRAIVAALVLGGIFYSGYLVGSPGYGVYQERGEWIAVVIHRQIVAEFNPSDGAIYQALAAENPKPLTKSQIRYLEPPSDPQFADASVRFDSPLHSASPSSLKE